MLVNIKNDIIGCPTAGKWINLTIETFIVYKYILISAFYNLKYF